MPAGHHASQYARERFQRLLKKHLKEHDIAEAMPKGIVLMHIWLMNNFSRPLCSKLRILRPSLLSAGP